ncbi:MAG: DUF1707 SHOCT-like domain-containing protein [Nocardioidaceae bacterium]
MAGELEPRDPSDLRISDDDRHRVAEVLRQAAGEGRIDFEELDQRLEATFAAKTYGDLVPITLDLPAHPGERTAARPVHPSNPIVGGPRHERSVAIMGGVERKGAWVVPAHFSLFALMGGAELDLREASFAAKEVVLTINAFMGGAEVTVNPRTNVVMEGVGIMGGYAGPNANDPAELDADSPVVRIRGVAIMGGVSVRRKQVRGTPKRPRLGGPD